MSPSVTPVDDTPVSTIVPMFTFVGSPVPIREDLKNTFVKLWEHLSSPGPTMEGDQRISLANYLRSVRRNGDNTLLSEPSRSHTPQMLNKETCLSTKMLDLAVTLLIDPASVDRSLVRSSAAEVGEAMTVEAVSIVSMLAAVDGTHRALAADLEPLPEPREGSATGEVAEGLRERRTHLPMPLGAIPVALDLLPEVGRVFRESFGPLYMTDEEMENDSFNRTPGLDRAQMEIISSRTSLLNGCFY